MSPLPFHLEFIQFLADHRTVPLTDFFVAVTTLGTFNAYILIVTFIYVVWNKKLAIRLAVLLLLTSTLNGLLKLSIRNPRPFVREGTYLTKWAVSAQDAGVLAGQYSTPSGHAMSAAAFYTYLYLCTRNWYLRGLAIAAILVIGFSRPYLGVHFAEDVLLGWALGAGCAIVAIKYEEAFCARWIRLSVGNQVALAVATSFVLFVLAIALNGGRAEGAPTAFLSDAGFLTGIAIAWPLEMRFVNFDPKSSHVAIKMLRFLLTGILVLCTLVFFNLAAGHLSAGLGWLGFVLQYVRFTAAAVVNIFLAPLLFSKLGLARTIPAHAN
jgi:membrane-associated phospholipid phosphatase